MNISMKRTLFILIFFAGVLGYHLCQRYELVPTVYAICSVMGVVGMAGTFHCLRKDRRNLSSSIGV